MPKELSLAQRKEVVSHVLAKYGDRLSPAAQSQLLAAVQLARPAATDPDLVKDRLVHSWATNVLSLSLSFFPLCHHFPCCLRLTPAVCGVCGVCGVRCVRCVRVRCVRCVRCVR